MLELKCPEFRTHSDDSDHAGGLAHVSSECLVQLQTDPRLHRGCRLRLYDRAHSHAAERTAVRRGGRLPRGHIRLEGVRQVCPVEP